MDTSRLSPLREQKLRMRLVSQMRLCIVHTIRALTGIDTAFCMTTFIIPKYTVILPLERHFERQNCDIQRRTKWHKYIEYIVIRMACHIVNDFESISIHPDSEAMVSCGVSNIVTISIKLKYLPLPAFTLFFRLI